MDLPRPAFAAGLPMSFEMFDADDGRREGMPRNGEIFTAQASPGDRAGY
jgi:hypothetical protein